jgi:hypothetical protein
VAFVGRVFSCLADEEVMTKEQALAYDVLLHHAEIVLRGIEKHAHGSDRDAHVLAGYLEAEESPLREAIEQAKKVKYGRTTR